MKKAKHWEQSHGKQVIQETVNVRSLSQDEFHRRWQRCLEKLTPEEKAELKKMDELRAKEYEWSVELEQKIQSGEAIIVEGDNWQQIIVNGEVVMFIDKACQYDGTNDDM